MDVEEVRKRKDEAEEKILGILQKFMSDSDIDITKIDIMKQSVSGYWQDKIVGAILTVEL